MKTVLLVGLSYSGPEIDGVDISTLGLCTNTADEERSAKPLYDYDVIVINPQSFSHFIFGTEGKFSRDPRELERLKQENKRPTSIRPSIIEIEQKNSMQRSLEGQMLSGA